MPQVILPILLQGYILEIPSIHHIYWVVTSHTYGGHPHIHPKAFLFMQFDQSFISVTNPPPVILTFDS